MKIEISRNKKEKQKTVELPKEIQNMNVNQKIERLREILMLPDNNDKSINNQMNEILLAFEKQGLKGKKKRFVLPGKIKTNIKKFHKKNKIMVFLLREGKGMIVQITEMFKGMIFINGDWHSVPEQAIFWYENKYPAIILPEWDLQALIPDKLYEEAIKNKRIVAPQSIILRALKLEETKMKAGGFLGGKGFIWIIIGIGLLLYLIFGG